MRIATTPTEGGFAVDQTNSTTALTRHHRADANTDGRLSLLELTRVIELFNVRTGAYRAGTTTTEDGFAPGP